MARTQVGVEESKRPKVEAHTLEYKIRVTNCHV